MTIVRPSKIESFSTGDTFNTFKPEPTQEMLTMTKAVNTFPCIDVRPAPRPYRDNMKIFALVTDPPSSLKLKLLQVLKRAIRHASGGNKTT